MASNGKKPALVVMAAGLGSRYGGLKQIEPVGPRGEIIMDYSVYDALRAGFGKIVFIVRRDMLEQFREFMGDKLAARADLRFVCQDVDMLPEGCSAPEGRAAPWGTGHAVLCCKDAVEEPFAVINADDFYGRGAFAAVAGFLSGLSGRDAAGADGGPARWCMAAYKLRNTLTEHGGVARGVCALDADACLKSITERAGIEKYGEDARYPDAGGWTIIPGETPVSMNMWGFTPALFRGLERLFPAFLDANAANLAKAEFFLPTAVGRLIAEGSATVKALETAERWFGVTYRQDRDAVARAVAGLTARGVYPENIRGWSR